MEIDETTPVSCSACGRTAPRGDMFGVEPDLLCEDCAEGVRKRMHVRFRPLAKEHLPRATAACLALAVGLYVCTHLIWSGRGPEATRPAWLAALYQDWDIWLGALWKHATSMFLHGNFIHLLFNGYVLFLIGRVFESRYGTPAFLAVLLLTGMAGQSGQWIASAPGAVGLSGGLLGLIGFLIARRRDDAAAAAVMNDSNMRFVLIYVVGCIVATHLFGFNVANVAHVVGLGLGWLIGQASRHPARRALLPAAGVLCLVVVAGSLVLAFGETRMITTTTTTTIGPDGRPQGESSARTEVLPRSEARRRWIAQHR